MVIGAIIATARLLLNSQANALNAYRICRQDLGRAIVLGTRIPCGGDIIRSVVVHSTLDNFVVLALIVVIRTFVSMTLQLEVEGHWPWQLTRSPTQKLSA